MNKRSYLNANIIRFLPLAILLLFAAGCSTPEEKAKIEQNESDTSRNIVSEKELNDNGCAFKLDSLSVAADLNCKGLATPQEFYYQTIALVKFEWFADVALKDRKLNQRTKNNLNLKKIITKRSIDSRQNLYLINAFDFMPGSPADAKALEWQFFHKLGQLALEFGILVDFPKNEKKPTLYFVKTRGFRDSKLVLPEVYNLQKKAIKVKDKAADEIKEKIQALIEVFRKDEPSTT